MNNPFNMNNNIGLRVVCAQLSASSRKCLPAVKALAAAEAQKERWSSLFLA
jgi:hypothetical protein